MNLTGQAGDHASEILFLNFNQDYTSLAVGTKTGYKLLSFSSVEKLEQIYDNESDDIYLVERLFASSLVAVVSLSSPRKLKVCHFKKGTEICNYSYNNSILGVKLNRQRLIVCLEESLFIHNIRDMKVLHTIRDTPPNPHGLCALSINNDNCFLAYPGSSQIGEVQIFDTVNLRAVTMIPAHDNPLAALSFNSQATKLATASEKGTVIRVFSIPDGQKLFEFRRGVKRCVNIYSLAFSSDSLYLSTSSNTETVHIFKLETPKDRPNEEPQSWMGYIGQALKTSANYLPAQVSEMLNQGRAFATARLPNYGFKNVCAISPVQKIPRLVVASLDGYLYIYNIDPNEGGECMLLRQHRLDGKPCDGHVLESPLGLEQDKPLAQQTGTPITYACTVKRPDAAPQGTPPPSGKVLLGAGQHFVPVGTFPPSPTPAQQPFSQQLETYAHVLKRGEGPKSCTTEECEFPDIAIILAGRDSRPYEEFDQGAVGGSDRDTEDLRTLQLDDDNEFPPMIHKIE